MNVWLRFLGIAGLVVFLFGLLGNMILAPDQLAGFVWMHIILGLAAIVAWFFTIGGSNLSNAGEIIRGRTSRFGANVVLYSVVFIGLLGVINYLCNRYDRRLDLTTEGVYSLKPQSVKLMQSLQKPLKIIGLRQGTGEDMQLEERLKLYAYHNPEKVSYEIINPVSRPQQVKQLNMEAGQSIYLAYGDPTSPQVSRLTSASEASITNAVLKLVRGEDRTIYFVTGHGEADIQGGAEDGLQAFATALADEKLKLENLNIAQKGSIPSDAAAVVLVAPEKELLPEERDLLISYAKGGGRLILMHEEQGSTNDVRLIAREFGIEVGSDIVIEPELRIFMGPVLNVQPQVVNFKSHGITADFSARTPVLLTTASSVRQGASVPDGGSVTVLMETGAQAWGETNLKGLFDPVNPEVSLDEKSDAPGPVSLAAVYEREFPKNEGAGEETFEKRSRVVVIGDSDWIRNSQFRQFFNRDLILAVVNWASAQEGGMNLEARSLADNKPRSPIADSIVRNLFFSSFILPEIFLLFGLAVWWQRRTAYV